MEAGGAERDKYRTAALRFDITGGRLKGANAGLNIFTGKSNGGVDPNNNFIEQGDKYRMGLFILDMGMLELDITVKKMLEVPFKTDSIS